MQKKLYEAVLDKIVERIVAGEFAPGAMLPSELDLAGQFGVSQGTARKALAELEKRRVVERRQGKGTFVALRTPENSLFRFFKLRDHDGNQVVPDLVSEQVTKRAATEREKQHLFGAPDDVFLIRRLRSFDTLPLCVEESIVPVALFPGLQERAPLTNALYVLFQRAYGYAIISAHDNLKADQAMENASELGVDASHPVLVASRIAFDLQERAVELRRSVYRTDLVHYQVRLD